MPGAAETPEHALTLPELVAALTEQGMIAPGHMQARGDSGGEHPLVWIARQQWPDLRRADQQLDLETLTRWLAAWAAQPHWRIDPLRVDTAAMTRLIPAGFAEYHQILALADDGETVTVASAQPFLRSWQLELERTLGRKVCRVIANPLELQRFIHDFYRLTRSVDNAVAQQHKLNEASRPTRFPASGEAPQDLAADDAHIVHIVDWLFEYAIQQRASDIHIEPRREQGVIRFRIDGLLHTVYRLPPALILAAVSRLKTLAGMNLAEKRKSQDGRMNMKVAGQHALELRLSTLPTAFGEKMVMRLFDPQVLQQSLEHLGFTADDRQSWNSMTRQTNGIILVTGPTGSGKTTTLYATLRQLATPEVNVCTVEDPIEMLEPAFNQLQVQQGIGLDFASAVRALMRQDPDIIMIGEIRDLETAEMAIQAALTGHLVLSTLHTNSAPAAVTRLLELGVPSYLLRATVLGVMAQRLLRRLCPACRIASPLADEERASLADLSLDHLPAQVFKRNGCSECRETGYRGREGIYEIMLFSEAVKRSVHRDTDLATLQDLACREGMRTLRQSAMDKASKGLTTLEEVMRVTSQG